MIVSGSALIALYLRGFSGFSLPRRRWPMVDQALRRHARSVEEAPAALRREGLWAEALALESQAGQVRLRDAALLLRAGRSITAASEGYPRRWLSVLGDAAPPALWRVGPSRGLPARPLLAIVGSRSPSRSSAVFAAECAAEASRLGFQIMSGGAPGVDRIAAQAALRQSGLAIEILPCGLESEAAADFGVGGSLRLAASEPAAGFEVGAAMERNALIYAAAEAAIVVQPRFRQGGTWVGAANALRRRLSRVLVFIREDMPPEEHRAARALIALGAEPVSDATFLADALAAAPGPARLFA
jgi:predicted Rossmann fold nucleotide-binding protein DprA/Smf involved in DNA uptake